MPAALGAGGRPLAPGASQARNPRRQKASTPSSSAGRQVSTPYYPRVVSDAQSNLEAVRTLDQPISPSTPTGPWNTPEETGTPGVWGQSFDEAEETGPWQTESNEPTGPWIPGKQEAAGIDQAKNTLEQALRAQRARTIGMDRLNATKPVNVRKQTKPLTWEKYNSLTPLQRSAVDYNTALAGSVIKDKQTAKDYEDLSPEAQENYDASITKMFGSDGGSDRYAPKTVKMLMDMDFTDTSADLDDFLQLRTLIRPKDVRGLEDIDSRRQSGSTDYQDTLIDRALKPDSLNVARDMLMQNLALSYEPIRIDQSKGYYADALGLLANPDNDPEPLIAAIKADLPNDEWEDLLTYAKRSNADPLVLERLGLKKGTETKVQRDLYGNKTNRERRAQEEESPYGG